MSAPPANRSLMWTAREMKCIVFPDTQMSILKLRQMAVLFWVSFAVMHLRKENYRSCIFIEMNRGLTDTEIFHHLKDANLSNIPIRTTVFQCFLRFQEGRASLHDDARCRWPVTCSDESSSLIKQLVEESLRQSTRTQWIAFSSHSSSPEGALSLGATSLGWGQQNRDRGMLGNSHYESHWCAFNGRAPANIDNRRWNEGIPRTDFNKAREWCAVALLKDD